MFTEKFNITGHDANTLPPECVGKNESGWEIKGENLKRTHDKWYINIKPTKLVKFNMFLKLIILY